MNLDNLDKLIEHLELVNAKDFRMDRWITGKLAAQEFGGGRFKVEGLAACEVVTQSRERPEESCGSAACIAGWATTIAMAEGDPDALDPGRDGSAIDIAQMWLGLPDSQVERLFIPGNAHEMQSITRDQALTVLRHLRKTGRVSWRRAGFTRTR